MNEQKVYDLIKKVEDNNHLYEEEVLRLLKFIYQDVYGAFDKKMVEYDGYEIRESIRQTRRSMASFLDKDEDSILFYLYDMILDNKTEYIEKFFEVCNRYFKIIDDKLYDKSYFNPITFAFNIYTFLKLYHENNDDFDYFSTMVDNFSFLIIGNRFFDNYYSSSSRRRLYLDDKKEVLGEIIALNAFDKLEFIKNFCMSFLRKIGEANDDSYVFDNYLNEVDRLNTILGYIHDYKNHPLYKEENVVAILEEMFSVCEENEYEFYFSPNYLLGDRYEAVKERIDDTITNDVVGSDLLSRVSELTVSLFDYLNKNEEEDSFIRCLDIVFDSDTYYELDSKLASLLDACDKFDSSEVEEALLIIKNLDSDKHKKVVLEKRISLINDSVNKVEKPMTIIGREKLALKRAFGGIIDELDENFDYLLDDYEDIDIFESRVTTLIEEKVREKEIEKSKSEMVSQDVVINAYNFDKEETSAPPQKKLGFFNRRKG